MSCSESCLVCEGKSKSRRGAGSRLCGRQWASLGHQPGDRSVAGSPEPSVCVHVGGGIQLATVREGPRRSGLVSAEVTRRETEARV